MLSDMLGRYFILTRLDDYAGPAVEDALLHAVDLSPSDEQQVLVEAIIDRNQPRGLAGIVGRYHNLASPLQARLREQADQLVAGIRAGVASNVRQTRMNALHLIAPGKFPALAHHAANAIGDVDRSLADLAADALLSFVLHYQSLEEVLPPKRSDSAERDRYATWADARRHVTGAVKMALGSYQTHQRPAVLECAVRLADELGEVIRPMIEQPAHPTGVVMQEMACTSSRLGRGAAAFFYLALSTPTTRSRFATRVGLTADPALAAELIARVARGDNPEVAKGLAVVRGCAFMNTPGWWERLPDELAEQTVRWIGAIGADPAVKAGWLTHLATDGSSPQRQAGFEQLCRWRTAETTDALKQVVLRGDADQIRLGGEELRRRGCADIESLMVGRLAHPDSRVRELAREQVGKTTFEKFWSQYARLPDEVREFAAGKLRRIVPDLVERLADKMSDVDPAQRAQALRVAWRCGVLDALREHVLTCCGDADSRVRASAVKLLGELPGKQSESVAQAALDDPDRRVRANAVEALEAQRSHTAAVALIGMLDDPDNRIRANAIKALMAMDLATARDSLQSMLADPSPDHRLSALWVVEQVGWFRPAEQVLRLAQRDTDRRVRARALRALSELRRLYRETGREGQARPAAAAVAGSRPAPARSEAPR